MKHALKFVLFLTLIINSFCGVPQKRCHEPSGDDLIIAGLKTEKSEEEEGKEDVGNENGDGKTEGEDEEDAIDELNDNEEYENDEPNQEKEINNEYPQVEENHAEGEL